MIASKIKDSRGDETILINFNGIVASSPSGKSKGKYEAVSYVKSLENDILTINKLKENIKKIKIERFEDLIEVEKLIRGKIGANSLFALESALLKLASKKQGKELYEFLGKKKLPHLVGNCIGGGMHSHNKVKPDFQEFLFIPESKIDYSINALDSCYYNAEKILRNLGKLEGKNDESAWQTSLNNESVLEVMKDIKENIWDESLTRVHIGIDVAASTFFNKKYIYKNPKKALTTEEQIDYIDSLIHKYNIFYVEDPIQEEDFESFSKLTRKNIAGIVGDDLTVTNLERLKKAIKLGSINSIIIKPNQNGSLIDTKKVFDLARKNDIKTIISHRSGETMDITIADLAVAWGADYIKTGIQGKERRAKLERLREIESKS